MYLLVPPAEFRADLVQERADLGFWEGHNSLDDPGDSLGTNRTEGPEENSRLVGIEDCGGTFEVH